MRRHRWFLSLTLAAIAAAAAAKSYTYLGLLDRDAVIEIFRCLLGKLGFWTIPIYVAIHTITLALCLPYAVIFEAGASVLFGFVPAVGCVFAAKVLAASLSFWIGRLVFTRSKSSKEWAQGNKYFHVLSKGVKHDGWKFVLLARFSPIPSYVINYALAATEVSYFVDFLLPTVIGCLPMILQNTSLGSLANAAVTSASGSKKSLVRSYVLPLLGVTSSILISLKIRKYSKNIVVDDENIYNPQNDSDSSAVLEVKLAENPKKRQ
ncbi:hypothetical protein Droror1_Dr00021804 [Drosera rotundifolia]